MSNLLLKALAPHHWKSISPSCRLLRLSQHAITSSPNHSILAPHHKRPARPAPALLQPLGTPSPACRTLQTARGGSRRREERWRRRDDMPDEFRLVYVAPSEMTVRAAAAAMTAPLLLTVPAAVLRPAGVLLLAADWQVVIGAGLYGLLAAAVLLLVRRYPFRMYHSAARRQFRAVLTGPLMVTSRQITLPEGSVSRVQSASNVLPWRDVLYTCGHGKLVLLDSGFQSAEMYNRLLGYYDGESGEDEIGE